MKHFILFISLLLGFSGVSLAKEVKPERAKLVAQAHYQQGNTEKSSIDLELVYTSLSNDLKNLNKSDSNSIPLFYVFNAENDNGFVMVSGDDNSIPILGYATQGRFDYSSLPSNTRKWIEGYKNQIRYIVANHIKATEEISSKWEHLEKNLPYKSDNVGTAVNPLLSTTWGQSPYVNDLCPYDLDAGASNGYHCVSGCPATAMAQIMKYWNYPANGSGFHSYNHPTYGTLSANFASTAYNWSAMPNNVSSTNNAVATLMYHCGVAVEMGYGPTSSGSYVIIAASPSPEQCSEYAYKTYFGYNPSTLKGLIRANYSDYNWIQLLKTDLDLGRPIQYAGFGAGGHTFVCDGYDINNYFHMNWGWGGYMDGFFLIDALNPGSGGTGSGAGTYNNDQQAVLGIQPLSESDGGLTSSYITLYDHVVSTPNPINYGQGFTVHTDLANFSTSSFTGDYCAAIFDESYNFLEFVEILSNYTIGSNQHYTNGIDFTKSGTVTLLPGSYKIGVFYRPTGGDWQMASEGSYTNMIAFQVQYANDIELYQNMLISCGTTITQNQSFNVTLDILNTGSSTFYGQFDVSLYNLDGTFAETIKTLTGASLQAGYYYDDLEFATSGVTVDPGTYLLAAMHLEDGGSWELTGSSYYSNPIYVTVKEQALIADIYENNNSLDNAYQLSLNFSSDIASTGTAGSNLHIGTDDDFYGIYMEPGYNYSLTVRAHDSYSSTDGQNYTCDVAWMYQYANQWSDTYDDVMPTAISVKNGGQIYFRVAPYFIGQTGTYYLDIEVSRTIATAIDEILPVENIKVYPNPAFDNIAIELENSANLISIKIVDMYGREVLEVENSVLNNHPIIIPIKDLALGSYMLLFQTEENTWQHKFIKSE